MNTEQILQTAVSLLAPYTQSTERPADNRLDVVVTVDELVTAVYTLHESNWGYLAAITGLDLGVASGEMEVLYHFCAGAAVVTLRVKLERIEAIVPTICPIIPSASFFERELGEMLGVTVAGTPNTDYLFLPDNWPQGVYPLRKDFQPEVIG
jgi:NADH:ubiquinone oxidoreductase subunit C